VGPVVDRCPGDSLYGSKDKIGDIVAGSNLPKDLSEFRTF
jgi:hypothetical protein